MTPIEAQEAFGEQFIGRTGLIDGDSILGPVELSGISLASNTIDTEWAKFGMPPGVHQGILVRYIPSGMTYDRSDPTRYPKEAGQDLSLVAPQSTWVTFPRSFEGLVVYYKRGYMAFAM